MKHFIVPAFALSLVVSAPVDAQQKPATAAEKEAAAVKAESESMLTMSAEKGEALADAEQKVDEKDDKAKRAEAIRSERELAEKRSRVVPLDIEVVISRYQGDKKVSSLPYALTVN